MDDKEQWQAEQLLARYLLADLVVDVVVNLLWLASMIYALAHL